MMFRQAPWNEQSEIVCVHNMVGSQTLLEYADTLCRSIRLYSAFYGIVGILNFTKKLWQLRGKNFFSSFHQGLYFWMITGFQTQKNVPEEWSELFANCFVSRKFHKSALVFPETDLWPSLLKKQEKATSRVLRKSK